jgi:2-amino-4-hydroxy-6-hydroxymethyldihydropteridine diphosphokinase
MRWRYLVALGSNRRHHRHGAPEHSVAAAAVALDAAKARVLALAPVLRSNPVGPSQRRYANSAALIETRRDPDELLHWLKQIERDLGRRRGGQRWSARVIDLDIILWDGGAWCSPGLTVPHPAFRERAFVLQPAVAIAPRWRDPLTGLTLRQLAARLGKAKRQP